MSPILLTAAIIPMRGLIMGFSIELVLDLNFDFLLLKSVLDSQVSSILMIIKSCLNSSIIFKANSCLRIKFLSELLEKGILNSFKLHPHFIFQNLSYFKQGQLYLLFIIKSSLEQLDIKNIFGFIDLLIYSLLNYLI